jgi:hypothetical protein
MTANTSPVQAGKLTQRVTRSSIQKGIEDVLDVFPEPRRSRTLKCALVAEALRWGNAIAERADFPAADAFPATAV